MIPRQFVIATAILFVLAIGMSIYVWQLRHREITAPRPARAAPVQHVTPPASGPTERVTVYVAYDNPGELRIQSIAIPLSSGRQRRAEGLLRGLLNIYLDKNSPHPLAAGAEVRDVYLVDPGLAVVDVNSALVDGQTSGVLAEELTVVSMIQTLSANIPGLIRVKVLVDGKERETLAGHADLLGFYDVSQVSELAKELSAQ
jgi:sporulation and spore germination protein